MAKGNKPGGVAPGDALDVGVAAVAGAQPAAPATRCQGMEIDVGIVGLHQGEPVNLRLILCRAPFRVRVHLDGKVIFDHLPVMDQVDVLLPPLGPGFHLLTWGTLAASTTWGTRSEVQVNGLTRFALNKSSSSGIPSNNLAVVLQVI